MPTGPGATDWRSLLALRRTRSLVGTRRAVVLAIAIGLVYVVISLLAGAMLELGPTGQSTTTATVLAYPVSQWWNYPALLVIGPWGVLALPFLATISMAIVAVGVGLGMGAGVVLAIRVLRRRREIPAGAGAAGSLAGLTPAMLALLTLGACCSTSAAAAAGIGAIAQSAGSSYYAVLYNSWYLNVFQVVVLGVALLAQEQLVAVYGDLVGLSERASAIPAPPPETPWTRLPIAVLRAFLIAGGTLWSLAWLLSLASPPAGAPPVAFAVVGFLEHPFVGLTAVGVGLAPGLVLSGARRASVRAAGPVLRGLLFLAGLAVAVGVPPYLTEWGLGGLGNQLLGVAGVAATGGGIPPTPGVATSILIAWSLAYAGIGLFAMALALRPGRVLSLLAVEPRPGRTISAGLGEPLVSGPGADPSVTLEAS